MSGDANLEMTSRGKKEGKRSSRNESRGCGFGDGGNYPHSAAKKGAPYEIGPALLMRYHYTFVMDCLYELQLEVEI